MPTQSFQHNPGSNVIYPWDQHGLGAPTTLAEITNGAYDLPANVIIPADPNIAPMYLGSAGMNIIQLLEGNRLEVITQVGLDRLNAYRVGDIMEGVTGVGTVRDTAGNEHEVFIPFSWTAPLGTRLMMHLTESGTWEQQPYRGAARNNDELIRELGPDFRFANGTEAADTAVRGYIARNMDDLVRQIASNGGVDGYPETADNMSGTVRALANVVMNSMFGALRRLFTV